LLVRHFVQQFSRRANRQIDTIPSETMNALVRYHWPGNIRELQNVIERAVILSSGNEVDLGALALPETAERHVRPRIGDALSLEELERTHIRGVMANSPSLEAAARTLGIDVSTLYRKRKQYGL
jgi:NtrC-family two-component system response regulator AlgB